MDIININFEQPLQFTINGELVTLTAYKLLNEPGNIKLGVSAPLTVAVDREEIYHRKRFKK